MGGYYNNNKMTHAYAGGFFDGEGSIGIYFGVHGAVRILAISHTNVKVLKQFKNKYGGRITKVKLTASHLGKKPIYQWVLGKKSKIQNFLKRVQKYLIVKAQESNTMRAEIAGLVDTKYAANELRRLKHANSPLS